MASDVLQTIGPLCDAARVTAELLLSNAPLPSLEWFSNGLVLELCNFSRRTHKRQPIPNVLLWLARLGFPSSEDLSLSVKNMWNQRLFLSKRKKEIALVFFSERGIHTP